MKSLSIAAAIVCLVGGAAWAQFTTWSIPVAFSCSNSLVFASACNSQYLAIGGVL
jgi:hypothetical protein